MNLQLKAIISNAVVEFTGVLCNQTGFLKGYFPSKYYSEKQQRVAYCDKDMNRTFIFLTYNFELSGSQIALLYKKSWQI